MVFCTSPDPVRYGTIDTGEKSLRTTATNNYVRSICGCVRGGFMRGVAPPLDLFVFVSKDFHYRPMLNINMKPYSPPTPLKKLQIHPWVVFCFVFFVFEKTFILIAL